MVGKNVEGVANILPDLKNVSVGFLVGVFNKIADQSLSPQL